MHAFSNDLISLCSSTSLGLTILAQRATDITVSEDLETQLQNWFVTYIQDVTLYTYVCAFFNYIVQELYFASYRSESMGNRSVVLQLKEIGPSLMPMDRYYTVYFYHYLAHTRMLSFSRNKLSKDTTMKSGM